MGTASWVFSGAGYIDNYKPRESTVGLAAEDSAHALDHLSTALTGRQDDAQVGVRYVHALIQYLGSAQD